VTAGPPPGERDELLIAARQALANSYSPYSRFRVGAALRFADGAIVTGTNVENASYGLSLCAETLAVAKAIGEGRRGGLVAVAVASEQAEPATPCGRCRQILAELAGLGETDPVVWCTGEGGEEMLEAKLSELLPLAFKAS